VDRRGAKRFQDLESAIDDVAASYDEAFDINNLESSALPSRRAVVTAVEHLLPVAFMGFYTTRSLSRDNLRHSIAEHLYAAHELLTEQIDRALTYERRLGRSDVSAPPGRGEDITLKLFRAIPELRRVLESDVQAAYDGDPAAKSIEEVVFSYPSILAISCYRIAHELHRAGVPMIPRIITEFAHGKTGIEISPGAVIGESFFIDHGTGVVIGETCILGSHIKLYQGVTLGALSVTRRECGKQRHPTLEDGVTVYAGATILGGETIIGKDSVIGGNVWLIKSVPPSSKVFFRGNNTPPP
tara:strand:- start:4755 stop:5651 length:897 start_codon:yes stop_codon:yes gene_type:complete